MLDCCLAVDLGGALVGQALPPNAEGQFTGLDQGDPVARAHRAGRQLLQQRTLERQGLALGLCFAGAAHPVDGYVSNPAVAVSAY